MQAFAAAPSAVRPIQRTRKLTAPRNPQRPAYRTTPRAAAVHVAAAVPDAVAGRPLSEADKASYARTFVDEEATAAANGAAEFPFSEAELIEMAKLVLLRNIGSNEPELLDESFEFVGPVVGPLRKEEFLKAFGSFDLTAAFPDARNGIHHMRVDPFMPNRVFFTAHFLGKVRTRALGEEFWLPCWVTREVGAHGMRCMFCVSMVLSACFSLNSMKGRLQVPSRQLEN
jgi:hypothetical protein